MFRFYGCLLETSLVGEKQTIFFTGYSTELS